MTVNRSCGFSTTFSAGLRTFFARAKNVIVALRGKETSDNSKKPRFLKT
jgi:hypothetical protein